MFALNNFGAVETWDGGEQLNVPLMYAELANQGSYSGADPFSTDEDTGYTVAEYGWAQQYGLLRLVGLELLQNSGPQAVLRLVENELMRAELSIAESLNTAFWADGLGNAGKDFNGLQALVDSTGTVGGINSATAGNEFWQSDENNDVALDLTDFFTYYLNVIEGADAPTNIFTTQATYGGMLDAWFAGLQRYVDPTMANAGFESILFHSTPISFDRAITAGETYLLNLKYIKLMRHPTVWFSQSEWLEPVNQDVQYKKILLAGQLVISNRQRQGKVTGTTSVTNT